MSGNAAIVPPTAGDAQAPPPESAPIAPPPQTSGAASSSEQQAPPPKDNFTPRKFAPSASSSTSNSKPDILRLVSTQPYHTVNNHTTSTFIPNTVNFFLVLAAMDAQMVNTHKFTQSNPNWHPLISQLYISLLIYIHIIKCMVESDTTNVELIQFYDTLYHHLGLESLIVPGPLVTLFAAITNSAAPYEWLGNISPTLPMNTGASAANNFILANDLHLCLPSIPFIIDQIHALHASTTTEAVYTQQWNHFYTIFSQSAETVALTHPNAMTPNARFSTFVPYRQASLFVSALPQLSLPTRHNTATNTSNVVMNYYQFFGFQQYGTSTGVNWLTNIGPIMSTYSTFFSGSVSLLSISTSGLGASLPVATYAATSNIVPDDYIVTATVPGPPIVPGYLHRMPTASNLSTLNHSAPSLSELAEQYSAIALVNAKFEDASAASTNLTGPTEAHLRVGHYWNLPVMRSAYQVDTQPGIHNNVTSFYHSATPIKK